MDERTTIELQKTTRRTTEKKEGGGKGKGNNHSLHLFVLGPIKQRWFMMSLEVREDLIRCLDLSSFRETIQINWFGLISKVNKCRVNIHFFLFPDICKLMTLSSLKWKFSGKRFSNTKNFSFHLIGHDIFEFEWKSSPTLLIHVLVILHRPSHISMYDRKRKIFFL